MSFDFSDRRKLDKIYKVFEDHSNQTITVVKQDPFKHLDQLADKVRYDMANANQFAKNSFGMYDKEHNIVRASTYKKVLGYINDIKGQQ